VLFRSVRSVEDTVRNLKTAARYLERTHSSPGHKVEVRVQISVEPELEAVVKVKNGKPVLDADGNPEMEMVPVKPAKSLVKFLGHEPWILGRRVSMVQAQAGEPAEPVQLAEHKHRKRTVAGHRKTALRRAVVRPVITPHEPQFCRYGRARGSWCFC
jgi:hypothetical protein